MELYVVGDKEGFTPEEYADVVKCLETLINIRAGSQPLNRDLGINYDKTVGYPLNVAKNKLSLEIIEKVEKYESRARVDTITFDVSTDGQLIPHIHFTKA